MYPPTKQAEYYPPPQQNASAAYYPPPQQNASAAYYPPSEQSPTPPTTGIPLQIECQAPPPPTPWSTGLCDCCDDVGNCCLTCFCPCVTFGQIAEIVDRGSTSCGASGALYTLVMMVTACQCLYSCFYRSKMRTQYSLHETPCNDCLVHCCCESCALCQEYRELQNRGYDMKMGWQMNVERRGMGGGAIVVPPATEGGMTR